MPTRKFDIKYIKMPKIIIQSGTDFEYSELTLLDFAELIIDGERKTAEKVHKLTG